MLVVFAGLAAVSLCGCARERSTGKVDIEAEKAALLARDHEWQMAVTDKKDAAKITAFFAADAVMFGSGETTLTGREALQRAIAELIGDPDFKDEWTWDRVELSPDGRLAYLIGTTNITTRDSSGQPATNHARLLNVWRKDPDGVWRCIVDVWVDSPAATNSAAGIGSTPQVSAAAY